MSTGTVSEVSESEVAVWLSWAQPFSTYPICTAFWKLVKKVAGGPGNAVRIPPTALCPPSGSWVPLGSSHWCPGLQARYRHHLCCHEGALWELVAVYPTPLGGTLEAVATSWPGGALVPVALAPCTPVPYRRTGHRDGRLLLPPCPSALWGFLPLQGRRHPGPTGLRGPEAQPPPRGGGAGNPHR